jgi:hypothetical protein
MTGCIAVPSRPEDERRNSKDPPGTARWYYFPFMRERLWLPHVHADSPA